MDAAAAATAAAAPSPADDSAYDLPASFFYITFLVVPLLLLFTLLVAGIMQQVCPRRRQLGIAGGFGLRQHLGSAAINAPRPPPPQPDELRIKEVAAGCTACAICLGEYGNDSEGVTRRTLRPCGHRFHQVCIDAWLGKGFNCPICRCVSRESSTSVHGQHSTKV